MKRNKGGVSFVKEATKRGFLIEKRKEGFFSKRTREVGGLLTE